MILIIALTLITLTAGWSWVHPGWGLSLWRLQVPPVFLWALSVSFHIQRHADTVVMLTGDSKLIKRENVSMNGCPSLYLSWVYPVSFPNSI